MKIGLYSITYGGVWYKGGALTMEEVFHRAKRFGQWPALQQRPPAVYAQSLAT